MNKYQIALWKIEELFCLKLIPYGINVTDVLVPLQELVEIYPEYLELKKRATTETKLKEPEINDLAYAIAICCTTFNNHIRGIIPIENLESFDTDLRLLLLLEQNIRNNKWVIYELDEKGLV